jgi:probable rRNA maturation factor
MAGGGIPDASGGRKRPRPSGPSSTPRAGRIRLNVSNRTAGPLPPAAELRRAAGMVFAGGARRRPLELSLLCVGAREMVRLNRRFTGRAEPTDVLSFPCGEEDPDTGRLLVGEVVICRPVARRESRARGLPEPGELLLYAVHGWLHLAGHDDGTEARRRRMAAAERRILARLGHVRD